MDWAFTVPHGNGRTGVTQSDMDMSLGQGFGGLAESNGQQDQGFQTVVSQNGGSQDIAMADSFQSASFLDPQLFTGQDIEGRGFSFGSEPYFDHGVPVLGLGGGDNNNLSSNQALSSSNQALSSSNQALPSSNFAWSGQGFTSSGQGMSGLNPNPVGQYPEHNHQPTQNVDFPSLNRGFGLPTTSNGTSIAATSTGIHNSDGICVPVDRATLPPSPPTSDDQVNNNQFNRGPLSWTEPSGYLQPGGSLFLQVQAGQRTLLPIRSAAPPCRPPPPVGHGGRIAGEDDPFVIPPVSSARGPLGVFGSNNNNTIDNKIDSKIDSNNYGRTTNCNLLGQDVDQPTRQPLLPFYPMNPHWDGTQIMRDSNDDDDDDDNDE